jgi:hypothetical protein
MGAVRDDYNRTRPADVQGALRQRAEQIWTSIENTRQLLRVMFREPEALDDMLDAVWSAVATRSNQHRAGGGAGLSADCPDVDRPYTRQHRRRAIPRSVAQVGRRRVHRHSADLTARCKVGCRTAGKHSVGRNRWRTGFGHGEVITTHGRNRPGRSHRGQVILAQVIFEGEVRRARSTGSGARLPVRSRRCAD